MDNEKKSIFYVVLALIVIGLLGWWLLSSDSLSTGSDFGDSDDDGISAETPEVTEEQLLGNEALSESQSSEFAAHKRELLSLAASGRALTDAEKSSIGNIMLTRAHLYGFTDEERESIFDALRR